MMGWGMDFAAWLWMAIWIAFLVVIVWLISRGTESSSVVEDALEILRARFARGEISEDEFEHARDVLSTDSLSAGRETK
jgi:putative membrane protein